MRPRRETVHGTLKVLDDLGIDGEIAVREVRSGPRRGDADVGPAGVGPAGVPPPPRAVVARVALHCRDLLFGSKVEGALRAAGHEVERGGRGRRRASSST